TLKSPSYTKSVSWQHYPFFVELLALDNVNFLAVPA
ncbi:transposase, partial [Shigella flexneri]